MDCYQPGKAWNLLNCDEEVENPPHYRPLALNDA